MLAMLFSRIGSIVQGEMVAVGLATENQAGGAAGRRRRRFDRECQRERQRVKAAEDSQAVCDAVHDVTKVFVPRVKAGGSVGESGSARQIAVS
jgi:hypothetical protein